MAFLRRSVFPAAFIATALIRLTVAHFPDPHAVASPVTIVLRAKRA
jgi:hypothetical protein